MEYVKLGIGTQDILPEMQNRASFTTGYAYIIMCNDMVVWFMWDSISVKIVFIQWWIFKPFNTRIQDSLHKWTSYIDRKICLCTHIYVHTISAYVNMSSLTQLLAIHLNEIADENSKAPQIPRHKIKIGMVDNTCFIT